MRPRGGGWVSVGAGATPQAGEGELAHFQTPLLSAQQHLLNIGRASIANVMAGKQHLGICPGDVLKLDRLRSDQRSVTSNNWPI